MTEQVIMIASTIDFTKYKETVFTKSAGDLNLQVAVGLLCSF